MKVGDLVRFSGTFSDSATIQDWGFGFIDEVYESEYSVGVIWPQKSWTSRTTPKSHLELINEGE